MKSTRTVVLGRRGGCRRVLVGKDARLRIVAPFGWSSEEGADRDLASTIGRLVQTGADAVQEVSVAGAFGPARADLVACSEVPYGTVLAYEAILSPTFQDARTNSRRERAVIATVEKQLAEGVDYMTVHASVGVALLNESLAARRRRAIALPSRAGAMIVRTMKASQSENPLRRVFPEIVKLCAEANAVISLGSTLRPAAISDALDSAQKLELVEQGRLAAVAHATGTGVLVEGLSHAIPGDIDEYVRTASRECGGAPITALGPLPVDVAAGRDDVAAAIGLFLAQRAGLALVNVVTAKEHIELPEDDDLVSGLQAAIVARHAAEVAAVGRESRRDRQLSEARGRLDWAEQTDRALFPEAYENVNGRGHLPQGSPCTICGQQCPLRGA